MSLNDVQEGMKMEIYGKINKNDKLCENTKVKETEDNYCPLTDVSFPSVPQPLLPPIHPLPALHQGETERKEAVIEIITNRIQSISLSNLAKNCRQDLAEEKKQLRELFVIAEKGIKENRASMARFYEIIKEENKYKVVIETEKISTLQQIEDYKKVEEEFTSYVEKYSIFEKFLEELAQVVEEWRNVRDILDRYETLVNTGAECTRMLESELNQADELRKEMLVLMGERSTQLKNLTNRLVMIRVLKKDARDKRIYWEHMMQRIKNNVLVETQESVSLKEGINDLYEGICKRLGIQPTIPNTDIEERVCFIHKNVVFFKEVLTIASCSKTPKAIKSIIKDKKAKSKKKITK